MLWQHGLNGSGQIIGIGDTGVDYDNCFFRDPAYAAPTSNHRKIVAYRTIGTARMGDSVNGHGTHTSGRCVCVCVFVCVCVCVREREREKERE